MTVAAILTPGGNRDSGSSAMEDRKSRPPIAVISR
jgi:hypothetical protein